MNRLSSLPCSSSVATKIQNSLTILNPCPVYWYDSLNSTMDEAKATLKMGSPPPLFGVLAQCQTEGRGTRGRTWVSDVGNMYLTVSFPLNRVPCPLGLTPLRIGTIVHSAIKKYVSVSSSDVFIKWPNDILIGQKKVCGMLIEMEGDYLVVGIGCNVIHAPAVEVTGADGGTRAATCLIDHMSDPPRSPTGNRAKPAGTVLQSEDEERCLSPHPSPNPNPPMNEMGQQLVRHTTTSNPLPITHLSRQLAKDVCDGFSSWLLPDSNTVQVMGSPAYESAEQIVYEASQLMDFSGTIQQLRPQHVDHLHADGRDIIPLKLNPDGSLLVRFVDSGRIDSLNAEYIS